MRKLMILVLSVAMLSAAFVGGASAQQKDLNVSFTSKTNYMSQIGYDRYLNHVQTGQWTAR